MMRINVTPIKTVVWNSLIAALVVTVLGCASSGATKAIGPQDMPSLAGKWSGTLNLPGGGATAPGTLEITPDGSYTAMAGAFIAQGKAQIKDGSLTLVPTMTTGVGPGVRGPRTSSASLSERPDGTQVLTGYGHSDAGPFDFQVSRRK
jgi:hypothetical protein